MRSKLFVRVTVTLAALMVNLAMTASVGADTRYPIMRPDKETLKKWFDDYDRAAEFRVSGPGPRAALTSASVLHHVDYVTADRNQGACGNCWVWAGTGCAEVAHHVENGVFDRLSIQYFNSNRAGGTGGDYACCGGWLSEFADFYRPVGFMIPWSNANAQWQDGGTACGGSTTVAGGSISTTPDYGITYIDELRIATQGVDQATAIANIKTVLQSEQGIFFGFFLADFNPFFNFWDFSAPTDVWDFDPHMGGSYDNGNNPGGHAVLCVGYNDDDPNNSYWIMLNSWGTAGGNRPDGLFRVAMDMNYSGQYDDLNAENNGYALYWQVLDIEFDNSRPECDADGPYEAECAGRVTDIPLDGTGSSDPDGDTLTYLWTTDCPGGAFDDATSPTPVLSVNSGLDLTCQVTLEVSDGEFADSCSTSVTITDTLPPVVSGFALTSEDVDANCAATVTFSAVVSDVCCQGPSGIDVTAELLTGNAVIAPWAPVIQVIGDSQFMVTGNITASGLTGCPVQIRVTIGATDCNGHIANPATGVATINDTIPPVITASAVGGVVDEACEYLMPFSGTVIDNCCVNPEDVGVNVALLTGNATLGPPNINKIPVAPNQVDIVGNVLVSDLTSCPATVQVTVDADDCCANPGPTAVATADVVDLIPPEIFCPDPITLERGDKICNSAVQDWLDSTTATDNCDPDVEIVDDSAANGFECGFPFDSTTTVTWTATDDCGNSTSCSSEITIERAKRVDVTQKGSVLIYPKIEIKWDALGNVTQDTFVTIVNDFPEDVFVKWYFVNGDAPLEALYAGDPPNLIEREHPGWNWMDHTARLTQNEPTYFSVLTGLAAGTPPFTALDPGNPPGRPDLDGAPGSRVLRGFVLAWAMDRHGHEITWNHLSGSATLVNYAHQAAWEYNASAYQARCLEQGAEPLDCTLFDANGTCCTAEAIPGELDLDGFQYDIGFDKLLLDFYTVGSQAFSDGASSVMLDTDLTLLPTMMDLRQDSQGPVITKAHFDIWNQNEDGFSGTIRCITCWDQTLLSEYELPNQFMMSVIHTDKGKARIDGVHSDACDYGPCNDFNGEARNFIAGWCSQDAPLLGVASKIMAFRGAASGRAYSGMTLVGQGTEAGQILADIVEMPGTLIVPPDADELLTPAPPAPVLDRVKRGR